MTRYTGRARAAIPAAVALALTALLAPPGSAAPPAEAPVAAPAAPQQSHSLLDPDGNPVVVDDGLHDDGSTATLLEPSILRASAVTAAAAPRAKKNLRTLVIPLYWSGAGKDTSNKKVKKRANAVMKTADTYFRTVSRGRIGHKTTVLGWQKIPRPATRCGIWSQMNHLAQHGTSRARRAGKNPAKFDRVIFYVTQRACGADHFGAVGLGSMPGRYVWLEGSFAPNVVIHELGHNLGLGHSNYAMCAAKNSTRIILGAAARCQVMEYADATDVMGNHPDAGWFSAPKLARLGWFTGKNLAKNTSAKKKTYTLRPLAVSTKKVKAVRVKGTQGRHYWVEYRTRTGLDAQIAPGLAGVQIRLGSPASPLGDSNVLDMLPSPYFDWFDTQTVSLGANASWTSPEGIRFSVGTTGATAKVTVQRKAKKAQKPLAPTTTLTATDLGAQVTWRYPQDRGTPVQSFTVRFTSADGRTSTAEIDQTDGRQLGTVLPDLDPSQTYAVSVRATNHRGRSAWSTARSVRPLDLRPSVTVHSPAPGATVQGTTAVTVTPTLPRGSSAELSTVEACFVDSSRGFDDYWSCEYVDAWTTPIASGQRLTLDLTPPWVDAPTPFDIRVEVTDTKDRSVTTIVPVTVAS